jgi:uncharacterized protein YbjT (DUF2867 family)
VDGSGVVLVTGATGRQGSAVTRSLLAEGRPVRALTRDPTSRKARDLAAAGAEVVAGDMDDPSSLDRACRGVYGVYSVQNHMISGLDGEVRQGRNVAEAARRAGVGHLVHGSAGVGRRGTGVGSWEAKLDVEDRMRDLGLPVTVLRPMAFMELMTDPAFHPAAGVWHVWPKLTGWDFEVPWLCCADLGVIAGRVFADPERYVGRDLQLAAEVRSLRACRRTYAQVMGRGPRRLPLPTWLFARFTPDTVRLWRWLAEHPLDVDTTSTLAIHPQALTVGAWLARQKAAPVPR